LLVIIYTVSGGNSAVSLTQRQQLAVVMGGMVLAGILAFDKLPEYLSFTDTVTMAGALGKFNMINVLPASLADASDLTLWQKINAVLTDRFNIWSGLIASVFLFLSYFGTDQSQVARYLGGKSLTESRLGLMFNGLLKIPMQFIILFIGVIVSIFYLFNQPPVFYNTVLKEQAQQAGRASEIALFEKKYDSIYAKKQRAAEKLAQAIQKEDARQREQAARDLKILQGQENEIRVAVKGEIEKAVPGAKTQDRDYMFLYFVLHYLPPGVVGLLLAVMFLAAMSSMAGELSALSSTTSVDMYKRLLKADASAQHYLSAGRWFTVAWALLAMVFAMLAGFAENLIQFVNIVGSLFYGTILGIFLTAFYLKRVRGTAVFVAALVAEATVLYCYFYTDLAFLLYNIIGCGVVMVVALLLSIVARGR
jgi:Na+/proline symporter